MNAISKLLDIALNEVGYLEKSSTYNLGSKTANAGKANFTKYARDMMKISAPIYVNGYAWCDTFVDWCMVQAFGVNKTLELIHGWSAYTPTSASYYKNHGEWHITPQKGDQIFFKDAKGNICHTGIVYEVDTNYVYTVEGNTSTSSGMVANGGCVAKKKYALNYPRIVGYGRPKYPAEKEVAKKMIYNTVNECPAWSRPYVQKAVDSGYIKGTDTGLLNLDDMKIWCLVVMLRMTGIMA